MDWSEIARRATQTLEESRAQRERLRAAEDRASEREQRRREQNRAPLATESRPPAPPELTREEKRKAHDQKLWNALFGERPAEEKAPQTAESKPATTEPTNPIAGTIAARIAEREAVQKARTDERSAAESTIAKWLGEGTKW